MTSENSAKVSYVVEIPKNYPRSHEEALTGAEQIMSAVCEEQEGSKSGMMVCAKSLLEKRSGGDGCALFLRGNRCWFVSSRGLFFTLKHPVVC